MKKWAANLEGHLLLTRITSTCEIVLLDVLLQSGVLCYESTAGDCVRGWKR